jgi:PST family polysaccharide transporter
MPAFARLQEHKDQRLATYHAITPASVDIVVPIFLGMALVVNELVPLIFGDKWLPSIPSMRVLLLIGIAQSITYILIALLIGTGHPAVRSRLLLAEALTKTACIMVVVNQGITAVSTAIVIAAFIMLPLWLLTAKRILAFSFGPYLKAIAPGVVSAAVMSVAILFTRQQLDSSLPPELLLAALVVVGISSYGLTMLVLFRATIINALNMLRKNR